MAMNLSGDPFILLSVVNTKLRDFYNCLQDLCESEDISARELQARLVAVGYAYDEKLNAFTAV